jgi:hypothetical protein
MKIDYTNPLYYYYESPIRTSYTPKPTVKQATQEYRKVESVEKGKHIDQYA